MTPSMPAVGNLHSARLSALEDEMAQVGVKRAWGARYLGGATMRNAWAHGDDLLVEAFNPGSRRYEVHCIGLADGLPKWVTVLGETGLKHPPGVGDVFVSFFLDGGGMKVVTRRIGSAFHRLRTPLRTVPLGSATSSDSTLYVASLSDQRVRALNPATGQVGWGFRSFTPLTTQPLVTPRLPRRLVVVGNAAGEIIALPAAGWSDIPPRNPTWTYRALGRIDADLAAATLIDTKNKSVQLYVVAACEDSGLYCLDGAAGVPRWIHRTDRAFHSAPQIAAGRAFARNELRMVAIDLAEGPDGPLSWPRSGAGEPLLPHENAGIVYAADAAHAYLGTGDRMVLRVDGRTGEAQAEARLAHFDLLVPALEAGVLVGLTTDGHVVAFH